MSRPPTLWLRVSILSLCLVTAGPVPAPAQTKPSGLRQMTLEECLDRKRRRCIPVCVNKYGYPLQICEQTACNPNTSINKEAWVPECRDEIKPADTDD